MSPGIDRRPEASSLPAFPQLEPLLVGATTRDVLLGENARRHERMVQIVDYHG
jgi:hypothetical protein